MEQTSFLKGVLKTSNKDRKVSLKKEIRSTKILTLKQSWGTKGSIDISKQMKYKQVISHT